MKINEVTDIDKIRSEYLQLLYRKPEYLKAGGLRHPILKNMYMCLPFKKDRKDRQDRINKRALELVNICLDEEGFNIIIESIKERVNEIEDDVTYFFISVNKEYLLEYFDRVNEYLSMEDYNVMLLYCLFNGAIEEKWYTKINEWLAISDIDKDIANEIITK